MKAIVSDRYGPPDALELRDIDKPAVKDDEVLVRIRAASVNPYDWHLQTGLPYLSRLQFGLRKPVAGMGGDLAGEIEAVGSDVKQFRPGDEVFGGVNGEDDEFAQLQLGSLAQYAAVAEKWVAKKPPNLTFEQAAAVPLAAITALQGLRDYADLQPEQTVLINGASGGVGTFAVQIAKAFGAKVTGVCSTRNLDLVRSIGADDAIDYTKEDSAAGEERYDLLLDNVGNRSPSDYRKVLAPDGMYLASFGQPGNRWLGLLWKLARIFVVSKFASQRMVLLSQHRKQNNLAVIKKLIEVGKITPVVDKTFPLEQAAEAMNYLEAGRTRGKTVVTV